nr:ATP-binding cassette domain-containing protein [Bacteroidia bacterium]
MMSIKNISKSFGKLKVLNDVNLKCNKGVCIALIGPNGCGKTTLIKSILGMVLPDSGEILIDGTNIPGQHLYRNKIGYMPQIGRYPDNMTIGQIIQMIKFIRKPSGETDEYLLRNFKLEQMYNKRM